jgi:hypothetical protein
MDMFRQSLDLSVSGTLAPGVELTGVLSDRNTPLTAEGSTQDLQSLDRVLLELRTPNGAASFGDVAVDARDGEFARVERRLQGVKAEWGARGFSGSVAAASAPGEFHRLQLFGVDGQQGPYLLTDRNGGTAITVVAGSEIVTVDGQRMERGEGADYAIEYDRARITFSNRRPITSASRSANSDGMASAPTRFMKRRTVPSVHSGVYQNMWLSTSAVSRSRSRFGSLSRSQIAVVSFAPTRSCLKKVNSPGAPSFGAAVRGLATSWSSAAMRTSQGAGSSGSRRAASTQATVCCHTS